MTQFKKTALAFVAAASVTLLSAAPAQAYVQSGAMVNMTNFVISGAGGQLDYSNFSFLTFTNSADYSGSLGAASFSNSQSGTPLNFPAACVGDGCGALALGDNTFPKIFAAPVGNYSAADQNESGSPITGIPDGTGGTIPSPATVANGSYSGLTTGSGLASSNSNNNLNSSFIFALGQGGVITFAFDVDAFLQTAISSNEAFPAFATASYQMDFTLRNLSTGARVAAFAPDLFGNGVKTLSLNAPLPINIQTVENTGGPIPFSFGTPALVAGQLYQLSARIQTNADVQRIPEPGVLSLLGIALLGATVARRVQRRAD